MIICTDKFAKWGVFRARKKSIKGKTSLNNLIIITKLNSKDRENLGEDNLIRIKVVVDNKEEVVAAEVIVVNLNK